MAILLDYSTTILPSDRPATGKRGAAMFRLGVIQHDPTAKRPLSVRFTLDGRTHTIACRASQLSTFVRFRQIAADQVGVWIPSEEYSGRGGRADWDTNVAAAFEQGRHA